MVASEVIQEAVIAEGGKLSDWQEQQKVPDSFVWGESERPDIAHNQFEAGLPIIDLKLVRDAGTDQAARAEALKQLREGLEEYGFFQVVNHDLRPSLADELIATANHFFPLPVEEKEKVPWDVFHGIQHQYDKRNLRWIESLDLSLDFRAPGGSPEKLVAEVAAQVYAGDEAKSEALREGILEYTSGIKKLGVTLLELIAESLEVAQRDVLSEKVQQEGSGLYMRFNWYPSCPQPELVLGSSPHTDPDVLTILHQDAVGGLQLQSASGRWVGIRPLPGALVANAGDLLMALTNGRCRSALHRVVTNIQQDRASLGVFLNAPLDLLIAPLPELVDDATHPACYRPFTLKQLRQAFSTVTIHRRQILDSFRI